ncbi:hypothetical protein ABBQ38_15530 [Trebouxia sp. C0009 RCD-2024]
MSDVSCGMFAMRADPEGPGMVHAAIPQDAAFVCYYRAVGIEHFYKDHHKKASAPGCIQSEPAALPVRFLSDSDDDVAGCVLERFRVMQYYTPSPSSSSIIFPSHS